MAKRVTITEAALPAHDINVDTKDGVIRNVKLCGVESKNKGRVLGLSSKKYGKSIESTYTYPVEELEKASYVGLPVYRNHAPRPERGKPAPVRDEDDQIGYVESEHMRADGKYGTVRLFKSDQRAPKFLERAKKAPHLVGFSHTASGNPVVRNGRIAIESIDPKTVDLVTDPATTAGLFESVDEAMTITELLEEAPEHKLADTVRLLIAEELIEGCDSVEGDDDDTKFKSAVKKAMKKDGTDEDEDEDEDEKKDTMPEKLKKEQVSPDEDVAVLMERVAQLEITTELQEAGISKPESWQINAVMSAENIDDKRKLVESFQPKLVKPRTSKPQTSASRVNGGSAVQMFEKRVESARARKT